MCEDQFLSPELTKIQGRCGGPPVIPASYDGESFFTIIARAFLYKKCQRMPHSQVENREEIGQKRGQWK